MKKAIISAAASSLRSASVPTQPRKVSRIPKAFTTPLVSVAFAASTSRKKCREEHEALQTHGENEDGWTLVTKRRPRLKTIPPTIPPFFREKKPKKEKKQRKTRGRKRSKGKKKGKSTNKFQSLPVDLLEQKRREPVTLEEFFPKTYFHEVSVNTVTCSLAEEEKSQEEKKQVDEKGLNHKADPDRDANILALLDTSRDPKIVKASLPEVRKDGFDPIAYKLMESSGYDFSNPEPMGKVVEVKAYGLNQTQQKLQKKGESMEVEESEGENDTPVQKNSVFDRIKPPLKHSVFDRLETRGEGETPKQVFQRLGKRENNVPSCLSKKGIFSRLGDGSKILKSRQPKKASVFSRINKGSKKEWRPKKKAPQTNSDEELEKEVKSIIPSRMKRLTTWEVKRGIAYHERTHCGHDKSAR
ncbi:Sal-like protein 4 [Bienertia sinuspersici]